MNISTGYVIFVCYYVNWCFWSSILFCICYSGINCIQFSGFL